ncbi:hypothetical protein DEO72_LG1g1855 [Vigna unguiculata]|uniref:Uncharacterized protein n=1 Tax=Vigna unguiculata TaxID=3917 RepID=A0A4D6KNZ2_VIGUN|nr:hypothetical protein DEO72_LG1g1855 [Vigna unguiculata]
MVSRWRKSVSPSSKADAATTTAAGSIEEPEDSVPTPRSTVGIRFGRAWRVVASFERQFPPREFRAEDSHKETQFGYCSWSRGGMEWLRQA